jgi:hypothetical protein
MWDKAKAWAADKTEQTLAASREVKANIAEKTKKTYASAKAGAVSMKDSTLDTWDRVKMTAYIDELTMNRVYHSFRQDMVMSRCYGLPGTDGTLWSNMKMKVKMQGSISGIFWRHELAPMTWKGHALYVFANCTFVFFATSLLDISLKPSSDQEYFVYYLSMWAISSFYLYFSYMWLACPCIYMDPFSEITAHNRFRTSMEGCCGCFASFASFYVFVASIAYIWLGIMLKHRQGGEFAERYFTNEVISLFLWDYFILALTAWWRHDGEKRAFEEKWGKYYIQDARRKAEELGLDIDKAPVKPMVPKSYTDLAKFALEQHREPMDPDYKRWHVWFDLDPTIRTKVQRTGEGVVDGEKLKEHAGVSEAMLNPLVAKVDEDV